MNKLGLKAILIVILGIILIIPGALFVDILAHEFYHVSKNKEYSEEICLNVNDITAYTIVNFPDYNARLNYNQETQDKEEIVANRVGKIASSVYVLLIILIFSLIFYLKK